MGNGVKAAKVMRCDQSTISRKVLDNCKFFNIELQKEKGEWNILGDVSLINKQRALHQIYRLNGYAPKRISLPINFRGITSKPIGQGWHGYIDRILNPLWKLELLRQSIVDAILCTEADEIPAVAAEDFHCIQIASKELRLITNKEQISENTGKNIQVTPLPVLVPDNNFWPLRSNQLRLTGHKLKSAAGHRYSEKNWEEPINLNKALRLGNIYDLKINPNWAFAGLPYTINSKITLITKKELGNKEPIIELSKRLLMATQD